MICRRSESSAARIGRAKISSHRNTRCRRNHGQAVGQFERDPQDERVHSSDLPLHVSLSVRLVEQSMRIQLTYDGLLLGSNPNNKRSSHKQEIRKVFHRQLRRLWSIHPHLQGWRENLAARGGVSGPIQDSLAMIFKAGAYSFVPLVSTIIEANCAVSILLLRSDPPGEIIRSSDLDNRLKTVFDALRMPQNIEELGGFDAPGDQESPFFCLLEDDRMITSVEIRTDLLLQAPDGAAEIRDNDVRMLITADVSDHYQPLIGRVRT